MTKESLKEQEQDLEVTSNNEETSSESSEDSVSSLIKQLSEAQATIDSLKNDHLRAVADLDNYRRRVVKEKEELRFHAKSSVVEGVLPVIDSFRLGMLSVDNGDDPATVVKGFEMVYQQFLSFLDEIGIEVLDPSEKTFDPNMHECVSYTHHETIEANYVIQVIRVGYQFQGKLLRPATVIVSQGPETEK